MMRIAAVGCGTLLALLLLGSYRLIPVGGSRWLIILGVLIFTSLLIDQIRQQNLRHKQAKHALIEIEKALEFFEEGSYLPGRSLYPQTWKTLPDWDWNLWFSVFSLLVLTALVILAFLYA